MTEFYSFLWGPRILLIGLLGFCVLMQTLALLLNYYRKHLNLQLILESLLEVFILGELLVFSALYGQMFRGYKNGFLVASGYEKICIFVFIGILILVFVIGFLSGNWSELGLIPLAAISLPLVETRLGHLYPWFFIGGLVFILVRSIKICIASVIDIKTSISALSVTHAIDILNTGILFSENDGHILLINQQMRNIMRVVTGKVFRNAIDFYNTITSDEYKSKYKKMKLEGQMVYLLADGSAWMFTKTDILMGFKKYIHISVTDVTKLWILTSQLQDQEQELRVKSKALKETMINLHVLSKKKEIENARVRAHDILGQRLTVLLRIIQNDEDIDYDLLTSLSEDLLKQLKAEQNGMKPYDELESIQEIFASIGIDISFEGNFPNHPREAKLFIDIIRESSTNAVRHGFATQINIILESLDEGYKLIISNNGYTTSAPITIGSGIETMSKKISDQGGSLEILQEPLFTLSVEIPGGD